MVQVGGQVVQTSSGGTVRGAGGTVMVQMVQLRVQVVQSGIRWYS
jgi:hypothetical protein